MRICKNGFIREMSLDEIEEFESKKEDEESHEMTLEERLDQVESVSDMAYINSELALAMLEGLEV